MAEPSFKLKGMADMFKPTDAAAHSPEMAIHSIPVDKLVPYKDHPFRLYEATVRRHGGERQGERCAFAHHRAPAHG